MARYMLEDHAKGWGIPSPRGADPSSDKPRASPTPMETETAGEEEEDAANSAAAVAKGWKGKGKQRAGKARRNRVAPASEVSLIDQCFGKGCTFASNYFLSMLTRLYSTQELPNIFRCDAYFATFFVVLVDT